MNWKSAIGLVLFLGVVLGLVIREEERGTFDLVERKFLSWMVSNTARREVLPRMTLVLFDAETSVMSGEERLGVLDESLFARAAARLGAVAAGIEGMSGDATRVVNAARGMRVFAGYSLEEPPREGWSVIRGEIRRGWPEIQGEIGRAGRYGRGFIPSAEEMINAKELQIVARHGNRIIPSFLALAWAAAEGGRSTEVVMEDGKLKADERKLPVSAKGTVGFFPSESVASMGLAEVLLEAERLERVGGESPLRGQILVLTKATSDITRIAGSGMAPVTRGELWARGWEAIRSGHVFLTAGWWYFIGLWVMSCFLIFGGMRRSNRGGLFTAIFGICVFCFIALGIFASWSIFLPLVPALLAIGSGLLVGRIAYASGWLGK